MKERKAFGSITMQIIFSRDGLINFGGWFCWGFLRRFVAFKLFKFFIEKNLFLTLNEFFHSKGFLRATIVADEGVVKAFYRRVEIVEG